MWCLVRPAFFIQRRIADDLPAKEGAHLPKLLRIFVAKCNDVLGIERDGKIFALTAKRYQASMVVEIGQTLSPLCTARSIECTSGEQMSAKGFI